MSDSRLTIRITPSLRRRLRSIAKANKQSESRIVRSLLERELSPKMPASNNKTFYDALVESGFLGCAPDAPPDLSTNKKYMEGFGEWDSDTYRRKTARLKRKAQ